MERGLEMARGIVYRDYESSDPVVLYANIEDLVEDVREHNWQMADYISVHATLRQLVSIDNLFVWAATPFSSDEWMRVMDILIQEHVDAMRFL